MKKKKNWLTSFRTDGRTSIRITLHCIVLHYIALHCIACITCIALRVLHCTLHCIAYWLNVMLIVRHVCSWIVPSVTFKTYKFKSKFFAINYGLRSDLCVSVSFVCNVFLAPDLRTDGQTYLLYATELKLNWNNWNLSVHPWHSYILTFYIDISILARGKMTSFHVRPSVHSDFHLRGPEFETWLQQDFVILYFLKNEKKKKKWLTDFIPYGRTDFHTYIALHCIALYITCIALHCIALHCALLHCIALHCIRMHTDWT
jgi:hypothetical protein